MVSSDSGYNPLRWDCQKDGCFNLKRRPKIEVFSGCFPGKINFGDVDGIVELNGKALMLEWKTSLSKSLPTGQKLMYERITVGKMITVLIIVGNAETMDCNRYSLFFNGIHGKWIEADLVEIKNRIKRWASWAKSREHVI